MIAYKTFNHENRLQQYYGASQGMRNCCELLLYGA